MSTGAAPPVWLSVDWDFFVREPAHFDSRDAPPGRPMYWEHRERVYRALSRRSLRPAMALRHAEPHPAAFWTALEQLGFRFATVRALVVADSHRYAARLFRRDAIADPAPGTPRLVHVDAHHDLFYSPTVLQWSVGHDEPTAENWHLFTLLRNRGLRSLVVYPGWKGDRDWATFAKKLRGEGARGREAREAVGVQILDLLRTRVTPCVWPDPRLAAWAGPIERVFIARSGGWTPDWHDGAFRRFCLALQRRTGVPISTPFVEIERLDPLHVAPRRRAPL